MGSLHEGDLCEPFCSPIREHNPPHASDTPCKLPPPLPPRPPLPPPTSVGRAECCSSERVCAPRAFTHSCLLVSQSAVWSRLQQRCSDTHTHKQTWEGGGVVHFSAARWWRWFSDLQRWRRNWFCDFVSCVRLGFSVTGSQGRIQGMCGL